MKTAFRATTAVFATAGLIALAGCAGSDGGGLSGEGYAGSEPGQLYHLGDDPAETVNLWSRRADVVDRIRSRIRDVVGADLPFSADHLS